MKCRCQNSFLSPKYFHALEQGEDEAALFTNVQQAFPQLTLKPKSALSFLQNQNNMRSLFALTLLITTFLSVVSCQKEIDFDQNNPARPQDPAGVTGNMKATINGKPWVADKVTAAARMQGLISIIGVSTDRKTVTMTLTDSGVHRYILSDVTMNAAAHIDSTEANGFAYTTNQGVYPTQAGGEVNITAIDTAKKTISGTFAFKVFREMDGAGKTITAGSFTNLAYSTTLPPSSVKDTFRVKIDGAAWTPASITGMAVPLMNQIAVNATTSNGSKTVGLVFPSAITPGSYTLDLFGATYIGLYNPDTDPNHSKGSVSGMLQILEHNTTTHRIRGNFNFRGEELLNSQNFANLTEGYFSVTY